MPELLPGWLPRPSCAGRRRRRPARPAPRARTGTRQWCGSAASWAPLGLAQQILHRCGQLEHGLPGVAPERGAVHHRQGTRLQRREPSQRRIGIRRVGRILRQGSRQVALDGGSCALDDAGFDQRLGIAGLEEQVRAQQGALGLVEEQAGVPAMRHVRGRQKAQPMPAQRDDLAVGEPPRGAVGEIVDRHVATDEATQRLRFRCDAQPLIQGAALVGLEVAESDPAQTRGIDDRTHTRECRLEHLLESRMHQERLVVPDQELVELNPVVGMEGRNPIRVRGDFGYIGRHATYPFPAAARPRARRSGLQAARLRRRFAAVQRAVSTPPPLALFLSSGKQIRLDCNMVPQGGAERPAAAFDVRPAILAQRLGIALRSWLVAIVVFAVADLYLAPPEKLPVLYTIKLIGAALTCAALIALRSPLRWRTLIGLALIIGATTYALCTISAIVDGQDQTVAILSLPVALATATLLPWGVLPQIAVIAIAAL